MEIYVRRGGMLQHIKLIQAENLGNLQFFFMWSERKRLYFATNKVLHIYSQDVRVYLHSYFLRS